MASLFSLSLSLSLARSLSFFLSIYIDAIACLYLCRWLSAHPALASGAFQRASVGCGLVWVRGFAS